MAKYTNPTENFVSESGRSQQLSLEGEPLRLDFAAHLGFVGKNRVEFSPREWALICYFDAHRSEALSYDTIRRNVFHNLELRKNTVVVHVLRINKKLKTADCCQRIEAVLGFGYRFMSGN